MVSVSQLSAGKTVYGHGSFAPTRGPVSAAGTAGYVKRELNNKIKNQAVSKIGNDGKSDSRSGLAQAALSRSAVAAPAAATPAPAAAKPATAAPLQAQVTQAQTPVAQAAQAVQATSAPVGTVADTVQVNSLGQLKLPYSANWGAEVLQAFQDSNASILQMQLDSQAENAKYADDSRNLDKNYASDQSSDLNTGAAGGTLHSSAYAKEVVDSGTDYNNQKNSLDSQHGSYQQGLIAQRNQISSTFDDTLRRAATKASDEAAANAGSLGYGKTTATSHSTNAKAAQATKNQHVMKHNRSVAAVAKSMGVSVKALKAANPRNAKDGVMDKGTKVNIPSKSKHTAKPKPKHGASFTAVKKGKK